MPNIPPQPELGAVGTEDSVPVPHSWVDHIIQFFTIKLARALVRFTWITPNRITCLSAGLGGPLAGGMILRGNYLVAAGLITVSGLLDSLDGDLARQRNLCSREGAILDSVLDRYVDFCLIAALILVSPQPHLIPGLLALLGTTVVPYIRARSEAEGKKTVASIGSRAFRTIVIIVGLVTGQLYGVLVAVAAIANIAALHRLIVAVTPAQDI